MARPSNTAERRAQITAALIKVMAKRGYDRASVADVAREAGLTPGLVHYHFESKQEILLAVLKDLVARHLAGLDRELAAAAADPGAQIDAFLQFHLGLGATADPETLACWVLLSGEALREPEIQVGFEAALVEIAARARDVIRLGVQAGVFACDRPREAAAALVAVIQGYFMLAATARPIIPRGSAARSAKRMAEALLGWRRGDAAGERP